MRLYRDLAVLVSLICIGACGRGDGGPQDVPESWLIDSEPLVSIGELDSEDPYMFARIADAVLLSDGRIVVADGMSATIRVFDPAGRIEREIGGMGDGPGEFRWINSLRVSQSDTIIAYDAQASRRTAYLATGELVSLVSFSAQDGRPEMYIGTYSDGSHAGAWISQEPRDPSVVTPDVMRLGRFDANGQVVTHLGSAVGMRRVRSPLPLSPHFMAVMVGDTVFHTDGLRGILEVTGPAGQSLGQVVVPGSEWEAEEALRRLAPTLDERWAPQLRHLEGTAALDSVPAISALLADDKGRLWAKQYEPETDSHWNGRRRTGGEWVVIERDGRFVARVSMPKGVRPLDVRGDRVLVVVFDEYDVERVQVRAVVRGGPAT